MENIDEKQYYILEFKEEYLDNTSVVNRPLFRALRTYGFEFFINKGTAYLLVEYDKNRIREYFTGLDITDGILPQEKPISLDKIDFITFTYQREVYNKVSNIVDNDKEKYVPTNPNWAYNILVLNNRILLEQQELLSKLLRVTILDEYNEELMGTFDKVRKPDYESNDRMLMFDAYTKGIIKENPYSQEYIDKQQKYLQEVRIIKSDKSSE